MLRDILPTELKTVCPASVLRARDFLKCLAARKKAERGNAASKSLPEAYRKIDNFEQERRFGLKAERISPIISDNPMAAFGRLLSYREPRAAMCRAAFPSCGIPQGGQPTAWEYSVKRQWRGGMAAFLTFIMLISGCSAAPAGSGAESRTMAPADGTHYEPPAFRSAEFHPDAAVSGSGAEIDLSAVSQGYVAVRAQSDKRLKCQVVYGDVKYNYDLPGDGTPVVYPLQSGNGQYNVRVMQNTTENKYMELFSAQADVVLDSEFEPFLRPSQRVAYSVDSACVLLASDIIAQAADAAAVVSSVYEYIQGNVDYDYDKAQNIVDNNVTGYLPDPDETLSTKKGICYDYAALAAAMLRSQGIPTKLITGYVSSGGSELYHAWNMIWLEESGWITVEIRAPRHEWQRIDLTFAAAGQSALVGDGKGYADKEVY